MERIKFTADTTCDLTKELLEEYNISTMPLIVTLGKDNFLDGVNVSPDDIYAHVERTRELPKTAARSPEEYKKFFKTFLDEGYDSVIHFNISSAISASNQNAVLAASDMENVHVIDSLHLSTGTSVLMFYAMDLQGQGLNAMEIAEKVNAKRDCVQTSFVVEKLEYLYKGGRCSALQMFGANLLKLRPLIKMKNGQLGVGGKYRGNMKSVMVKYIEDLAMQYPDHEDSVAFITHTECEMEVIDCVKQAVGRLFRFKKVYDTLAGGTITSHCGRGTLGLLFMNNESIK